MNLDHHLINDYQIRPILLPNCGLIMTPLINVAFSFLPYDPMIINEDESTETVGVNKSEAGRPREITKEQSLRL